MGKYFGTDGIRGPVDTILTDTLAYRVGFSLKSALGKLPVVIGMDTRASSESLVKAIISGLETNHQKTLFAGVVSTPVIAHYSKMKQYIGIMITASHNPYTDNGIKIFNRGNKLSLQEEADIEAWIDTDIKQGNDTDLPELSKDVINLYTELYKPFCLKDLRLRVVFDTANGALSTLAEQILRPICKEFHVIHNTPNGRNINENCGSTYLKSMTDYVKSHHLDLGFSFDGDGDRCLIVDGNGQIYDGDQIMYALCVSADADFKNEHVVLTKMANLGIIKAFEKRGFKPIITDVGDKYVAKAMKESNALIGGEASGHIIMPKLLHTGDGLLLAASVLEMLHNTNASLKELLAPVHLYPQKMVNITAINKEVLHDNDVKAVIKQAQNTLGSQGRILVRPSGTEPVIRVTVTHKDIQTLEKALKNVVDAINEKG